MRWRAALKLLAALLVSAGCLAWLLRGIDRELLAAAIAGLAPLPLVLALALALTLPFWRGARLAQLIPATSEHPSGALTRIAAEVLFWSFLLPFKLGELSFLWFLHRRLGVPSGQALAAFVLVRFADLAAIVGLGAIALALVEPTLLAGARGVALAGGIAAILSPLALVIVAGGLQPRSGLIGGLIDGAARAQSGPSRAAFIGTTLGIWATHATIVWLVLQASGLRADAPLALLASSAGNLGFALPVPNVLGLGPQQVAMATVLEHAGVLREAAVGAAIATYVLVVGAALLCGAVARWGGSTAPAPLRTRIFGGNRRS